MNMLKFSNSCRCASVAIVSNTIEDFPEPETPVKIVIFRFGIRSETSLRLFSRAPRISMNSSTSPPIQRHPDNHAGPSFVPPIVGSARAERQNRPHKGSGLAEGGGLRHAIEDSIQSRSQILAW